MSPLPEAPTAPSIATRGSGEAPDDSTSKALASKASAGTPASDTARPPLTRGQWALRLSWLAIQIILVLWFGQKGVQFVYQGF